MLVRPSFAAYGERRDGSDWDGAIGSGDLGSIANISRRGFTGHEHLDAVGLIHMNGRVYEPVAERFLGSDPLLRFGLGGALNSYSYALNNPLRFVDPSGFCDTDPVTGQLVNCPLPGVDVTAPHWDECDWGGGRWLAGWGEFCTEGWDPYWDHDPFADFDEQGSESGGSGNGTDEPPAQPEEPSTGHDYKTDNMVCNMPLSIDSQRDVLQMFAVPSAYTLGQPIGDGLYVVTHYLLPGGFVTTEFSSDRLSVENTTTFIHMFVGTVEREIYTRDGATYIRTHGYGNAGGGTIGFLRDWANEKFGPAIFNKLDMYARFYTGLKNSGCR